MRGGGGVKGANRLFRFEERVNFEAILALSHEANKKFKTRIASKPLSIELTRGY